LARFEQEERDKKQNDEEMAFQPTCTSDITDPVNAGARRLEFTDEEKAGYHEADEEPAPGGMNARQFFFHSLETNQR